MKLPLLVEGKNLFSAAFPIHKAELVVWLGFLI